MPQLVGPQAVAGKRRHRPAPQGILLLQRIQPALQIAGGGDKSRRWGPQLAARGLELLKPGLQLGASDRNALFGQIIHHLDHPQKSTAIGLTGDQGPRRITALGVQGGRGVQTELLQLQLQRCGDLPVGKGATEVALITETGKRIAVLCFRASRRDIGLDHRSDLTPARLRRCRLGRRPS